TIMRRLATGDVNFKTVSGPVGLGQGMWHMAETQTFLTFLWWLGFLSLNLGVFNLLPIPLLDGWHLVLILVEKLKGSPVPMRIQEACQYVGLFLILALVIMATRNDILRMFFS
ncbi:MAG: site-2 protease family protein, partial [Planctomycetota bacterium]